MKVSILALVLVGALNSYASSDLEFHECEVAAASYFNQTVGACGSVSPDDLTVGCASPATFDVTANCEDGPSTFAIRIYDGCTRFTIEQTSEN